MPDEQVIALRYDWPFWARPEQLAPPGIWWLWLVLSGRGYGKTRIGAEWVREQVRDFQFVNLIAKSRDEYRDVMIEGESGIMAVCHPDERPVFRKSLRRLDWPNGAQSLCFSAEEPEQLRGPQHQRLWGDEFAKWPYLRETWDMAVLGLRLPPDPRVLLTSTPKPVAVLRELIGRDGVKITKGSTYENRENLAPQFFDELITKYEGTRLGRQELQAELLLDEGLAYKLVQGVHVVPPFPIDNWWDRFEAMDYGTNNPCWLAFAVDYDGNIICFGLENEPGIISDQAARIHRRRETWWSRDQDGKLVDAVCYAPPDIRTKWGKTDIHGNEMGPESEFAEHGIRFSRAQNDRRAGYARVLELLKVADDKGNPVDRRFPDWHPLAGEHGAPRFYIVDSKEMLPLIDAIRDAPIEDEESPESRWPGEAVDRAWEHTQGHAHAACRYGLMSRPDAASKPTRVIDDPRQARVAERLERIAKREQDDLVNT